MTPAEFIREVLARELEWLEGMLRELPDGETLCVHEEWIGSYGPRRAAHHLLSGANCTTAQRKTQYGPMTPELRALAETLPAQGG